MTVSIEHLPFAETVLARLSSSWLEHRSSERFAIMPHGNLPVAAVIDNPEKKLDELRRAYSIMKTICKRNNYAALAGTQLPRETVPFEFQNVIYVALEDMECSDMLLVNPIFNNLKGLSVSIEGCGSIQDCQTGFLALRPFQGELSGIRFKPGKRLISERQQVKGLESAIIDHEMQHLNGQTIIDTPNRLVPVDKIHSYDSDGLKEIYTVSVPELVDELIRKEEYQTWLSTREDGTVVLLEPEVNYLSRNTHTLTWREV